MDTLSPRVPVPRHTCAAVSKNRRWAPHGRYASHHHVPDAATPALHEHASMPVALQGAILQWPRYPLLLNHRDCLILHHIIRARQASDDEQCAGGGIARAALLTDLTYGGGVVEVRDIRRCLHNIVERATYGLDGGLQVMPYLSGLGFGVTFAHDAAVTGGAHLAGDVDGVADFDHVGKAARLRHSVGIHVCFTGHTGSFLAGPIAHSAWGWRHGRLSPVACLFYREIV